MKEEAIQNKHNFKIYTLQLIEYLWNAFLAIILLVIFSPVLLIIFILLALTKHYPIYIQKRVGKSGRIFYIYKFRTMVANATYDGPFICTDYADPRITGLGKFLRKNKLDELPQLINVILGDMSFIGPRPEIPHFHEKNKQTIANWEKRLSVKPGISGLAQIDEKVSHDPAEKIVLDLEYIRKKSFRYDIYLMLLTLKLWILRKPL